MRIVDVLYSLPFIFFVIMLVVFFGRNFVLMFLAVGAVLWLDMARIVRGQALSIRRQEYVQAAEALGVGQRGILLRHVIPNLLGPVVIYMTLLVPQVIILESFLSFLGLGVQEPMTSWGVLISAGAKNIGTANWLLSVPGLLPRLDAVCAELHRRRPARRARPEGPLSRWPAPTPILAVQGPQRPLPHARRRGRGGQGHQPRRQGRRDRRDRRRIRVRQEPDHDGGDAACSPPTARRRGIGRLSRHATCWRCRKSRAQPGPRPQDQHDLPGADDLARSALHDRQPADRADPPASQAWRAAARMRRPSGCCELVQHSRARAADEVLSARAVRRPAPARDDRHGARQRSRHPDRRRADDGARRDHPGADPGAAGRAAGAARHGDRLHHPRPRHRPPLRRPRLRHAPGEVVEEGDTEADLRRARSIPTRKMLLGGRADRPQGAAAGRRADPARRHATSRSPSASAAASSPASRSCCAPSTASRSRCAGARRSASSANPARASRRSGARCCAVAERRRHPLRGPRHVAGRPRSRCGRCAANCRSSSRIRSARCRRA